MGKAGIKGRAHFYAYDKKSGDRLWETLLPAGTTGGPISYEVNGRQFIVVPVGARITAALGSPWD